MHRFDISLEINLGMSIKCKLRISHHRMKQVLNKFRIKWCLSSYFSLPAKLLLIRSVIYGPIRAPPGRFDNTEVGRRLTGELIGLVGLRCPSVGCRPHSLNTFSSETTRTIEAKFLMESPRDGGTKVCLNGPGHKTKMAAIPIYGKNLKNLLLRNQKADDLETLYATSSA